jgi:uncharacterized iron-regulated membrane protein
MSTDLNRAAQRRSALWRIHCWAALFASPFALAAALTGLLYVFTPQIEHRLYAHLDQVTPQAQMQPLDEALKAARTAVPSDWTLQSFSPAPEPSASHQFAFVPPKMHKPAESEHGQHQAPTADKKVEFLKPIFGFPKNAVVVHVNPYSLEVLGQLAVKDRFTNWSRKLHSNWLQTAAWRWLIEFAASWMMVLLLSGLALAWPLKGLLPKASTTGRPAWKQWHVFLGVTLALMSLAITTTGLTWSQNAGQQVRVLRDAAGQSSPQMPASIHSDASVGLPPLTWQQAWEAIQKETPPIRMQILPPKSPHDTWRAAHMERTPPTDRFDLLLDAYTGEPLFYSGWGDQSLFGQATAVGIPFHRGELGWWNQALLLVFGLGVVFSLVSGWVMVFKRRRLGMPVLPELQHGAWASLPWWSWLVAASLLWLMPLLAISAAGVVVLEMVWWWRARPSHHTN